MGTLSPAALGPPVVRTKGDLHNLSQDSGLSYSPVLQSQSPQLTIGSPIRALGDDKRGRSEKRWSISGMFKRKSVESRHSGSEGDVRMDTVVAPKSGVRKRKPKDPTAQNILAGGSVGGRDEYPPPLPPRRSQSATAHSSRSRPFTAPQYDHHPSVPPPPQTPPQGIFPHLRADLKYPDSAQNTASTTQLNEYYFHPRFGFVKTGSYYDQQISYLARANYHESVSSRSSGLDSELTGSLDLGMQPESSEEDEYLALNNQITLRGRHKSGENFFLRNQSYEQENKSDRNYQLGFSEHKYVDRVVLPEKSHFHACNSQPILAANPSVISHHHIEDRFSSGWSHGRPHSPKVQVRTAAVVPLHSPHPYSIIDNEDITTAEQVTLHPQQQIPWREKTSVHRNVTNFSPPPPPPPRNPRRRVLSDNNHHSRPMSYSFETVAPSHPEDGDEACYNIGTGFQDNHNKLPLPPRKPISGNRLSLSDQYLNMHADPPTPVSKVASPPSQWEHPPRRGEVMCSTASTCDTSSGRSSSTCTSLYVDQVPRSRKPILLSHSSPVIDNENLSNYLSAVQFWAPHQNRLDSSEGHSPPDSITDNFISERDNIKTPNRDSAIVSNISTPLPNCDSPSVEKSGKSSPSSVSSKDSGCSEPRTKTQDTSSNKLNPIMNTTENATDICLTTENRSNIDSTETLALPGFSSKKRRSLFQNALTELLTFCDNIEKDEDLLDRAERRDLPTAHQQLIWEGRDSDGGTSDTINTSTELAFSDIDNIMNWNTSSSFENIPAKNFSQTFRAKTPASRRSGVIDKKLDDMAFRKIATANKIPTTTSSTVGLSDQSYLNISPMAKEETISTVNQEKNNLLDSDEEPDITRDDLVYRSFRDSKSGLIQDPQPKFGIPLGPLSSGANSDYLHAVPEGKYRSTFHSMRNPDLVKDDLAFRHLRKDDNISDPNGLGIVKESHGIIRPRRAWPYFTQNVRTGSPLIFYPNKHSRAIRSLSEGITDLIKKQSTKPSAEINNLISYNDLMDVHMYDSMRYGLDKIKPKAQGSKGKGGDSSKKSKPELVSGNKRGLTVYEILKNGGGEEESEDGGSLKLEEEFDLEKTEIDDESTEVDDFSRSNETNLPEVVKDTISHSIVMDGGAEIENEADSKEAIGDDEDSEEDTPDVQNTQENIEKRDSVTELTVDKSAANDDSNLGVSNVGVGDCCRPRSWVDQAAGSLCLSEGKLTDISEEEGSLL